LTGGCHAYSATICCACSHFCLLAVHQSAHAAARDRAFVASYGSDSNPCTFLSPCKTFQQAVNVVASGGEVTAIDSAGFGPISITKPITITSPDGVEAGIVPNPGGNAITINTPGDVFLRGLTLEGNNSGVDGISLTGSCCSGTISIVHCVIRHFTHDGIYLQPTGVETLTIIDTIAANNGNDGIDLSPSQAGSLLGVIDHSTTVSNGVDGMSVYGANATSQGVLVITIVNSVTADNFSNGVKAFTIPSTATTSVMVRDTTATQNNFNGAQTAAGFLADGTAAMSFAHVNASFNTVYGIYINNSAIGVSFGDNYATGNAQNLHGTLSSAGFL